MDREGDAAELDDCVGNLGGGHDGEGGNDSVGVPITHRGDKEGALNLAGFQTLDV